MIKIMIKSRRKQFKDILNNSLKNYKNTGVIIAVKYSSSSSHFSSFSSQPLVQFGAKPLSAFCVIGQNPKINIQDRQPVRGN